MTGVGFNQNGDLSVYGADGNLYNPDSSAYDVAQSITVNAGGGPGLYTTSPIVSTPIQYVATLPSGFNQPPVNGLWTYGNWCDQGGQGAATNQTDAACIAHDACYFQGGFTATTNFGPHNAALQACNQQLCNTVKARQNILVQQTKSRGPFGAYLDNDHYEAEADGEINDYFTIAPRNGNGCH